MKNTLDTIDPKMLEDTTGGGLYDTWKKTSEKVTGVIRDVVFPRPRGADKKADCIVCGLG